MVVTGPPVPSFRHDRAGTAEQSWGPDPRWDGLPDEGLLTRDGTPAQRVVVVAAHPDDESLGAGGLLATATGHGLACWVVVATDGEGSHPRSPTHTPSQLAARRRRELVQAVTATSPSAQLVTLGLPDGAVGSHTDELVTALTGLVDRDTLLVAPWRGDGHPDHRAAGEAAAQVAVASGCRLLEYPIWLWHWGSVDDLPWNQAARLPLSPSALGHKTMAIDAHASQLQPLSDERGDEVLVGPDVVAHFLRPWETFIDAGAVSDSRTSVFDTMFDDTDDPWRVTAAWYEERKRAVCLAMLPARSLGHVLEVGCSIGVLTEVLAGRAEHVLGTDVSTAALLRAGQRLNGRAHVRLRQARMPSDWPSGRFDTVVVSEVGYFLDRADVHALFDRAAESLSPDGSVLVCNWRHPIEGWDVQGAEVNEIACRTAGLEQVAHYEDADFVVDVLRRPGLPSIAATDGLV